MAIKSTSCLRNMLSKQPLRGQLILLMIFVFFVLGSLLFISLSKLIQSSIFREIPNVMVEPTYSVEAGSVGSEKTHNPVIIADIEFMESAALVRLQTKLQKTIGLILFGALLIGLLLSIFLSRFITSPIENLSKSMASGVKEDTETLGYNMPSQELSDLHSAIMLSLSRFEKQIEIQNQFLLDVAHEFRTPVASIRMKVDVDKNKTSVTPDDFYSLCATVDRSTIRLEQLITKLRCLSSDQNAIHPSIVSVRTIVTESIELLLPLSRDKNIDIQNLINLNHFLISEPLIIQTIITNLIENSILYNKQEGKVVVSSIQTEEGCEIRVEDTGIGIEKEELEKIFNRFYRVDKSRSRRTGGSGLGLPIVKALVNKIGGHISLGSEIGKGTVVELFIPNFQEDILDLRKEIEGHEEL